MHDDIFISLGGIPLKHFKLLLKFMRGNILLYLVAIAAICLSTVFTTTIPMIIRVTIDSVIGSSPIEAPAPITWAVQALGGREKLGRSLWMVGVGLALLTAGQGLFLYLKDKMSAVASQNSGKRIRDGVFDHLQHLPFDYHVKSQAGDLIQRCTSDVETIQNFVSSQMIELSQSLLSFAYILFIMFSLDAKYAIVSITLIPVILFITIRFFNDMKRIFRLTDESEGRLSTILQENLTGVRVVKAFGTQNFEAAKYDEGNRDYRDKIYNIVLLMSNFWSNTDFLCLFQYCVVLLSGVYFISKGSITLGTLVAFSTYAGMLIWPVRHLGQMLAFMGQAFVSLTRIQEILDHPVEATGENEVKPGIKGELEFKNVYFEYTDAKPVLKDVSLKIKKGQTVAILGATGSGKSSLVHLLLRLYDYQRGSIKLDGVELKSIDRTWLRKHVGIVLQEPFLFSKSVKDNVKMGRLEADEKEVYESASIAAVHNTVLGFEKGYETIIGERGVTLSGGQRQRLAIARTIIRKVPILIFDDSLSAVDMETDAAIRRSLQKRSRNTTTIIISHRITTLAEADVIFVLEGGKIRQQGTHEQLINQEGLYRRVWDIQNSLEEELSKA